ncbi:MAG: GNAT family N-acetyltransferase [Aeromicrobium sp.]
MATTWTQRSHDPAHDVDDVLLADGTSGTLRRLRPDDRPRLTALFDACGDKSLYTRFFSTGRGMVTAHLDHLFDESTGSVSYVVERGDRIIGVADVEPCGADTSEIAFLVADDCHALGVATLLLERAAADASAAGVAWFVADVLSINHPMLAVFRESGFHLQRHDERGDTSLRMSTEITPAVEEATHGRRALALQRRMDRRRPAAG